MTDPAAVAIVGMSGRFPGARDIGEFWANLRSGTCSISDFGEDELLAAGVPPQELHRPDYVPAKGHLADADRFEAELFGFNRTEAAALDPQHRLLLETAWSALEDAGYDPRDAPARTGVYVGGSATEHMVAAHIDDRLAAELGGMQLRILTDREFLASLLSYRLGLDGPSLNVQAACATSLVAVHLAVQSLLLGECDTALAGGVAVDSVHPRGYRYAEGGIYSPDGRCRPFDEQAAGTVGGNGVGLLVLRRLEDALADGDPVRAVIRGTAVTNDGATKVGFTAPGVDRQTAAVAEAWAAAGLEPAAAQYLEMHGTGTDLGDRIEIAAATAALGPADGRGCGIGSVKSNIGHLDAAAGVAGLIKVVLMLEHRTLVPTAGVTRPHPDLAPERTPLRLVTGTAPWEAPAAAGPRLAGVSSIGIGGTNAHVVLAQAPEPAPAAERSGPQLLPLSARTEPQLAEAARRLAAALRSPDAPPLADAAYTLRTGRAPLPCRAWVVAGTAAEAADALDALAAGTGCPAAQGPGTAELRALGEAWARGEDPAWPAPPEGVRRVHLPTHPFAGDRHGALTLGGPPPAVVRAAEPAATRERTPEETEAAVTELLSTSLGLTGPDDLEKSYFAVGGDSLTAIHLITRIRDELGLDAPVELFLDQLSLRELAARISGTAAADDEPDGGLLASLLDEIEAGR